MERLKNNKTIILPIIEERDASREVLKGFTIASKNDPTFRESQLKIDRTEEVCIQMDKDAQDVRRLNSSVESISFQAKYAVLLLSSRKWKKSRRDCRRLKENEKKRQLDGMKSSKSKSNAHCMHG